MTLLSRQEGTYAISNGSAAAALISSSIGCAVIGVLTVASAMSTGVKSFLNFYGPAGSLTGKATIGIISWLIIWAIMHSRWKNTDFNLGRILFWFYVNFGIGLLLTFPTIFEIVAAR